MLNALSKYVSGYLKKPPQQPSGTADPIDKSADDDSGLPPDQDLFETVGKVVVGLDLGLKEDFPILEPKATITTQEVENAEWIFVADKTGTADKNNKVLHARLDEETKTPSYASTAAKAPPPPPPISTPQQYNKKTSTVPLGNGAKVELKKQIAQGRINCDNNYEINRSPLINSESKDGGLPSPRSVKNAGTQFPASQIFSNRTPGMNGNSRKNNNSNITSKNTSAFLFIDTNMHSGDKFDHENGAVLLNENRLITLTEKVDSVDRELDKALLPPHGSSSCRKNGGISSKSAGLRASLKSLKSELKAVNTPTSLVLVRGRGTPKKEEASNFDQSKEVAAKWEISDKYRKVDSLRRQNYHCFLLPEEEDCLTPDEDGEEYLTHKTATRGGGKKGGGRRRGIRTGDDDDEQQRNATTTQAADSTSAASVPITTDATGRTLKPAIRATRQAPSTTPMVRALTKFHDTWDRKKGHGDKAKTFNQAQKEALKSYRRRHRNTDSTNSSASSADVNINTCSNNDYSSAFSLKQLLGKKLKSVRREQSKNKKIKKSSTNSLFKQDEGTNTTGNLNSCGSLNLEIPITIDPYSVKNPNMDSSYHTADFSSNVISSPTLATTTVGKKNLQHSDALTFFQACDRHFSRKYLARKKKAVSQRRNPYNGKFMQYMTSSALLAASSDNNTPAITIGPLNRGDLIEGGLSQQKDAVEARKSKKHNGGRFYYAQKTTSNCMKKRSGGGGSGGIIQQPIPKTYLARSK